MLPQRRAGLGLDSKTSANQYRMQRQKLEAAVQRIGNPAHAVKMLAPRRPDDRRVERADRFPLAAALFAEYRFQSVNQAHGLKLQFGFGFCFGFRSGFRGQPVRRRTRLTSPDAARYRVGDTDRYFR